MQGLKKLPELNGCAVVVKCGADAVDGDGRVEGACPNTLQPMPCINDFVLVFLASGSRKETMRVKPSNLRLEMHIAAHAHAVAIGHTVQVTRPCHISHLTHHTSHLTHHTSHLTPHSSHLTPHTSHLTPHTSHLTPHTSHITPHTSHLTPHTSHLTSFILRISHSHPQSTLHSALSQDVQATIGALSSFERGPPINNITTCLQLQPRRSS